MRLNNLKPGKKALIKNLLLNNKERKRISDLGFIQGALIETAYKAPLNSPIAFNIKGSLIALRTNDSSKIEIQEI